MEKRKSSIDTVSHDDPIHLRCATFHHGRATNDHHAFTLRYRNGASTVQDGSATTCSSYCILCAQL